MTAQPTIEEADALYAQYGQPLEPQHEGQYAAITRQGRTVIAATVLAVADRADEEFGPTEPAFIFKIGGPSVYKAVGVSLESAR